MNNYKLETKKFWKNEIKKHVMLYPDERVVAFISKYYKEQDNSNKNALDLGFGSGRNLIPLLDNGFNSYGIDYNEECCKIAKKILKNRNNLKELYNNDIRDINFEEGFFDVVINNGISVLVTNDEFIENLKNIHKIMKKGGKMFVNFRTKDDFLFGKGEKLDEYSFKLDERAKEYSGGLYSFYSYEEAERLIVSTGFKVLNCERKELWKNGLEDKNKWWIFSVECI
ncbi:bifunctional 2-polyprenyl-6-hydroxyphenol methylase/3-demethylubiquinol 3-O-methyltransferase UbiG [uncultured Clostridium sp.]|uniref:class I SAM-dependent methyltransferase n=1 Tax=uncultured Clostridium sp. TaxID=59620 RepID=UPI0025ED8D92|nr:class I SAM-dependent methyltransferase [uncultured Clostridium sp.]